MEALWIKFLLLKLLSDLWCKYFTATLCVVCTGLMEVTDTDFHLHYSPR